MARMVRKQVLLDAELEHDLENVSAHDGVSQGAFVRRAIRDALVRREAEIKREEAWDWLENSMRERAARGPVPGGRTWKREDLYDR